MPMSDLSRTFDRLGQLYMYDAPGIFHALWKLVSPFIDHHTRSKIKFLYGKEGIAEFQRAFPPEVCLDLLKYLAGADQDAACHRLVHESMSSVDDGSVDAW